MLTLIIAVAVALFLSAIIRQISGFGFALLSMPLITLIAGIRIATPLVAVTATTIACRIRDRPSRSFTTSLLLQNYDVLRTRRRLRGFGLCIFRRHGCLPNHGSVSLISSRVIFGKLRAHPRWLEVSEARAPVTRTAGLVERDARVTAGLRVRAAVLAARR